MRRRNRLKKIEKIEMLQSQIVKITFCFDALSYINSELFVSLGEKKLNITFACVNSTFIHR